MGADQDKRFKSSDPDREDAQRAMLRQLATENSLLTAVAEAARAEVLAQGYRSTDMAKALKALYGEWWFEDYVSTDKETQ
jgi:hypothetical protein